MENPTHLYHGTDRRTDGPLQPMVLHVTDDHAHERPAVFATARKDLAALFMFPKGVLSSIGFEHDVAYICIWGTSEDYAPKDAPGFIHVLSPEGFEKRGKDYEWLSYDAVTPESTEEYPSALEGMMRNGVQAYFIDDEVVFDRIVDDKTRRADVLRGRTSENALRGVGERPFPS